MCTANDAFKLVESGETLETYPRTPMPAEQLEHQEPWCGCAAWRQVPGKMAAHEGLNAAAGGGRSKGRSQRNMARTA